MHSGAALEALRERRDLSISDLESDLAISLFGVVKHLVVLQRSAPSREGQHGHQNERAELPHSVPQTRLTAPAALASATATPLALP